MLPEKFREPAGFQWGFFTDAGGARIRYGLLNPAGEARGAVVIVTGFRELIEKYFELARELTAAGFAVWIMDWRGQGGSERLIKSSPWKMHGAPYEEHIATLRQFAGEVVQRPRGPLVLVAHSMGAHIGLRTLKEHAGIFDAAVLTAPMFDIWMPRILKPLARAVVRLARRWGWLEDYALGGGHWSVADDIFEGNKKTSDPARFNVPLEIFKEKPELRMGRPTYGWVLYAYESVDVLNDKDYLKSIRTPILAGIAGDERIVDKAAAERACGVLPDCTRVDVAGARHEIWMERDELRAPWLARVLLFLEDRVKLR